MTRIPRLVRLATVAVLALLAGCGFHLRESTALGFSSVAFQGQTTPLLVELKRRILATTATTIETDPKRAQAVFTLLQDGTSQLPVAYNADGTVAQYELRETVRYQLADAKGALLLQPTVVSQASNLSYSTSATLAKANEADLLYRGMRRDLVDRIMFQLAALRAPKP